MLVLVLSLRLLLCMLLQHFAATGRGRAQRCSPTAGPAAADPADLADPADPGQLIILGVRWPPTIHQQLTMVG